MIEVTSSDSDALIRFYTHLKTVTQITSYIGLAATSSLSVFDLLYKQKSDPLEGQTRYRLNKAGRARLITFLTLSLVTVTSTITKDYADSKLDAKAHEQAQAEFRATLGGSLDNFARRSLAPSIQDLSNDIRTERETLNGNIQSGTQTLNSNIGHAVTSLNKSVIESRATIQKNMLESAAEAEVSNARIDSFTVQIEMGIAAPSQERQLSIGRLRDWEVLERQSCSAPLSSNDSGKSRLCFLFTEGTRQLMLLSSFVSSLDHTDTAPVEIKLNLRSFRVGIFVPRSCVPFPGDREYNLLYDRCIRIDDEPMGLNGTRYVELLQAASVSHPTLEIMDSGFRKNGLGAVIPQPFQEELYGRDADLMSVVLHGTDTQKRSQADLPGTLHVTQTLNLTGRGPVTRSYDLHLSSFANDAFFDDKNHPSAKYER